MTHLYASELLILSRQLLILFSIALFIALLENQSFFLLLNNFAQFRPLFWLHLTHFGDILIAVSLFSIFVGRRSKLLYSLAVSIIFSVLIVQGLKHAINAPRPAAVLAVNEIHVIGPSSHSSHLPNPVIDYERLIDTRPDTAAAWDNIQSDPNSREARYWVPRMDGVVTKKQFGIAFASETLDLEQGTYQGIYRPSARSFPSGHTATIACALTLIMLHFRARKWAWSLALAALAVGCSRIVVGVHWPIDVAVGGLIGWVTAVVGTWISHRIPVASIPIGHYIIALIPGLAASILLFRKPIYPDVALFEVIIGVSSLLITTMGLWRFYRKN